MGKQYIICLLLLLQGVLYSVEAQNPVAEEVRDSSLIEPGRIGEKMIIPSNDTIAWVTEDKTVAKKDSVLFNKEEFKPDSKKAVIYSAIFPGLGQFYNRKYWKLPIIYGGFVGLAYAISWNGSKYNDYSKAYMDIMTGSGNSWEDFLGYGVNPGDIINNPSRLSQLQSALKRRKDYFRRNRDLAIIATVGVYALCMIDAYVDAQLYNFDISPDISMHVEPVILMPTSYSKASVGLRCRIDF